MSAEEHRLATLRHRDVVQDLETRIFNLTERAKTKDSYIEHLEVKLEQADERNDRNVAAAAHQREKAAKAAKDVEAVEAYVQELEAKLAAKEEQVRRLLARVAAGTGAGASARDSRRRPNASIPNDVGAAGNSETAAVPSAGPLHHTEAGKEEEEKEEERAPRDHFKRSASKADRRSPQITDEVAALLSALDAQSLQIDELSANVEDLRDQLQAAEDENNQQAGAIRRLEKQNRDLSSLLDGSGKAPSLAEEVERSAPPRGGDPGGGPAPIESGAPPGAGATARTRRASELERELEAVRRERDADRAALRSLRDEHAGCRPAVADPAGTPSKLQFAALRCRTLEAEAAAQAAVILGLERGLAKKDREARAQMEESLKVAADLRRQIDAMGKQLLDAKGQLASACADAAPAPTADGGSTDGERNADASADVEAFEEALRKAAEEVRSSREEQARLERSVSQLRDEIAASKARYDAQLRDRLKEAKVIHEDWKKAKAGLEQAESRLKASSEREDALKREVADQEQAYAALGTHMETKVAGLEAALDASLRENDQLSKRLDAVNSQVKLLEAEMSLCDSKAALAGLSQKEEEGSGSARLRAARREIKRLERDGAEIAVGAEYMAAELCNLAERLHRERERRRNTTGRRSSGSRCSSCASQAQSRSVHADLSSRIQELELALTHEIKRSDSLERYLDALDRERSSLVRRLPPVGRLSSTSRRPKRARLTWSCLRGGDT